MDISQMLKALDDMVDVEFEGSSLLEELKSCMLVDDRVKYDNQETITKQQQEIKWLKGDGWISVYDKHPKIGQKVLLLLDGIVQEEIYMYDEADIDDWHICQFWSREDVDNNKVLGMTDMWQPLPKAQELKGGH